SGLLGGPLLAPGLAVGLALEATGVSFPAPEPGLAGGGRARQTLTLTTTWLPAGSDRLQLPVVAGRGTGAPDRVRCTHPGRRVDQALAAFAGLSWAHRLGRAGGLEVRLSGEHRREAAAPRTPTPAASHLNLTTWITAGAPGPLAPDLDASTLDGAWTRVQLAA